MVYKSAEEDGATVAFLTDEKPGWHARKVAGTPRGYVWLLKYQNGEQMQVNLREI